MYKLPFQGTVRSVVHDADGIHVDMVIEDADGKNVHAYPFTTGPRRTAAEVCEMAQAAVSQAAKSYHARDLATLGESSGEGATDEEKAEQEKKRLDELEALKGRTFTGSMTR